MKVHFFERQTVLPFISIEKLFSVLKLQLEKKGVVVETFKNPYSLNFFWKALWYFNKNQGQINHITGDIHWTALALNSKNTILTIHDLVGLYQLKGLKKRIYFLFWIYLPIKKLKYITVISEKTKNEILQLLPWASKKIFVIPNCLTIEVSQDFEKQKNSIPKILIVGTRANKNIDNSIQALINIKCELNIVGEINKEQKAYLDENKTQYKVHLGIDESNLIELYKISDILLFPSLYEGFGLPILEAQACQCVVITSNISPMKEVAGGAAILVNPNSVKEMEDAITLIITNADVRKKLINSGIENIKQYEPEIIAQKYLELYHHILSKN